MEQDPNMVGPVAPEDDGMQDIIDRRRNAAPVDYQQILSRATEPITAGESLIPPSAPTETQAVLPMAGSIDVMPGVAHTALPWDDQAQYAREMGAKPVRDQWDAALQDIKQSQQEAVFASLASVADKNPDQVAKQIEVADQLGVNYEFLARNEAEMMKRLHLNDVAEKQLPETAPVLADHLADPQFAAVAKDDIDTLSWWEKWLKSLGDQFWDGTKPEGERLFGGFRSDFSHGFEMMAQAEYVTQNLGGGFVHAPLHLIELDDASLFGHPVSPYFIMPGFNGSPMTMVPMVGFDPPDVAMKRVMEWGKRLDQGPPTAVDLITNGTGDSQMVRDYLTERMKRTRDSAYRAALAKHIDDKQAQVIADRAAQYVTQMPVTDISPSKFGAFADNLGMLAFHLIQKFPTLMGIEATKQAAIAASPLAGPEAPIVIASAETVGTTAEAYSFYAMTAEQSVRSSWGMIVGRALQEGVPLEEARDIANLYTPAIAAAHYGFEMLFMPGASAQATKAAVQKALNERMALLVTAPTVRAAVNRIAKSSGVTMLKGAAFVGIQATLFELANDSARVEAGMEPMLATAEGAEQMGKNILNNIGYMTIGMAGMHVMSPNEHNPIIKWYYEREAIQRSLAQESQFRKMGELANDSKTAERAPDAAADFANSVVANSDAEHLYISKAGLRIVMAKLDIPIERLDEIMPGLSKAMNDPASGDELTNGYIKVKTGDFLAKHARTPIGNLLMDHITRDLTIPTTAERRQIQAMAVEFNASPDEMVQQVSARLAANQRMQESADRVAASTEAALVRAGRPAEVAKADAEFFRAWVSSLAEAFGITPEEAARRFPTPIGREGEQPVIIGGPEGVVILPHEQAPGKSTPTAAEAPGGAERAPTAQEARTAAMLSADESKPLKRAMGDLQVANNKHSEITINAGRVTAESSDAGAALKSASHALDLAVSTRDPVAIAQRAAELRQVLDTHGAQFDPRVTRMVEKSLGVVDRVTAGREVAPQPGEVLGQPVISEPGPNAPGVGVEEKNKHGFMPALRVMVPTAPAVEVKRGERLILADTTNANAPRQIANLDDILARFPNAAKSPQAWAEMLAHAFGSNDVPVPPFAFIRDTNGDGSFGRLSILTPGQIADASHGFDNAREFRQAYTSGKLTVATTGKLFLWSFLSRGVSPYTQESLFIDAFTGADAWIQKAAAGNFTAADLPAYEAWAKSVAPAGAGQPGAGATHNLNAFGTYFLLKMGEIGADGKSNLQRLHEMMCDPNQTGRQIRREFAKFGEGVGIDNKVVSFTLLVSGFNDVMVLDRVQVRQLWDDGRFSHINLYDGEKYTKFGLPDGSVRRITQFENETDADFKTRENKERQAIAKEFGIAAKDIAKERVGVAGSSLNPITQGVRGILIYEAIERQLAQHVTDLYAKVGRPQDASIGRYHWETWVAFSGQEAAHSTLEAILLDAKGDDQAIAKVAAKQGEYGAFEYGTQYHRDSENIPWFRYSTPLGGVYDFSVPAFRRFLTEIKKAGQKVVPSSFKVSETKDGPWFNRPEVNQQRLEQLAAKWADRGGGSGNGSRAVAEATANADAIRSRSIAKPAIGELVPQGEELAQAAAGGRRGWFNTRTKAIGLTGLQDFSTFIHETTHRFWNAYLTAAAQPDAPAFVRNQVDAVLRWFGIEGATPEDRLAKYMLMSPAEREPHEEALAYSHEIHVSEGKAPNERLQPYFERFAEWLKNIYGDIKGRLNAQYRQQFGRDLPIMNSEIRDVMDRFLASEDSIRQAEEARNMKPQFQTQEESGMDDVRWAEYQALQKQRHVDAVNAFNADSMKTLQWVTRANIRATRAIKAQNRKLRENAREEIEAQVMAEPLYRAIAFIKHGETIGEDGKPIAVEGGQRPVADLFTPESTVVDVRHAIKQEMDAEASRINKQEAAAILKMLDGLDSDMTIEQLREKASRSGNEAEARAVKALDEMHGKYKERASRAGFKLNTEAVRSLVGEERAAKLKHGKFGMLAEDGMHPDLVASMFGYNSGEDLVNALIDAKPIKDEIDTRTDAKLFKEHGDLNDPARIQLAVERALHREAHQRVVADELRALKNSTAPLEVMMQAARSAARDHINNKRIRDIQPSEHSAAEAKAARVAQSTAGIVINPERAANAAFTRAKNEAMAAGLDEAAANAAGTVAADKARTRAEARAKAYRDQYGEGDPLEIARRAKQQQLFQSMLVAEAVAARDEVEAAVKDARKMFASDKDVGKTRNIDKVLVARALLARFGIGHFDGSFTEQMDKLKELNPTLHAATEELRKMVEDAAMDHRDLNMTQFRALMDAANALWTDARNDQQVTMAERKVSRMDFVRRLVERLVKNTAAGSKIGTKQAVTLVEKTGRVLNTLETWQTRFEHFAQAMDGGKSGPFTDMFRRVSDACVAYRKAVVEPMRRYAELLKTIDDPGNRISCPQLGEEGYTFSNKKHLLAAMLHMGNESNLTKLLLGRGWGSLTEDGHLDTSRWTRTINDLVQRGILTKNDFDFLQGVWDLCESMKPDAWRVHKELHGYYPKEVEATPINTPWGEYRGGYVPAKGDPYMTPESATHDKLDALEGNFQNVMPTTGKGFTITRTGAVYPLALDLNLIGTHIDSVMRYIHIQPAIKDVVSVINTREFKTAMASHNPAAREHLIIPFLQRAARQTATEQGQIKELDHVIMAVKRNLTLQMMCASVRQFGHAFGVLTYPAVGTSHSNFGSAVLEFMGSPREVSRRICELSPMMDERLHSQIREQRDIIRNIIDMRGPVGKTQAWVQAHAMFLSHGMHNVMDIVTWSSAFNQAIEDLGANTNDADAQREAVARADAAVRMTQGAEHAEDKAAYQQGKPAWQAMMSFTGYLNTLRNLNKYGSLQLYRELGIKRAALPIAHLLLFGFVIPMLGYEAVVKTATGTWKKDKDEDWKHMLLDYVFDSFFHGAVGMVPFGGTAATAGGAVVHRLQGKPTMAAEEHIEVSPILTGVEQATVGSAKALHDLMSKDKDVTGHDIRDVLTLVSILTSVPTAPAARAISYQRDVKKKRVIPSSAADYVRGLMTGSASTGTRRK